MIVYPNAKINIGLRVLNKCPDGFHNLETVFYPVPVNDILEIVQAKELKMFQYGIEYPGNPMDNLCVKAYNILKTDFDIPEVEIHLFKKIPVGAGLGGGSSDAAFTLKVLDKMFNLNISQAELARYASMLGSDCPFFIYNTPMLGRGRGEILSPIVIESLKEYKIKMVYPPCFVSTADAYKGIIPRNIRQERGEVLEKMPLSDLLLLSPDKWRGKVENDFEATIFAKFPKLEQYKTMLYEQGAVYASMSGSGSSMFGIFAG